ncbi:MAG: phage holin family protein [Thermoanaerobaculia bacterium]|nr:phage holin family protein [Thermoanaerobaculia bacterium]
MRRRRREWKELLAALGRAFGRVLGAELGALRDDFLRDGKHLGWGVGFVVAAGALGAWSLGVLTALAIAVLAIWLPLWGAILVVLGVLLAVIAVLLLLARSRFRRLESPAVRIQDRWEDHRRWWDERILGEPERSPSLEEGSEER